MNLIARWLINLGLLVSLCLFATGVFAPLMELEKFWIFKNQFSLYSGLYDLWLQGEHFLFIFLFLFSILTPLVKIFGLALVANSPEAYQLRHRRFLQVLAVWGKWSMLDVFVVALLFVAVKLGALANITVHYGLYLFASSVILVQILSLYLYLDSKKPAKLG
ncbi:paraquat-inducible protein A [Thiothrix eikelboomii]|uniref:paraquat-inducible protein A n=1 Tax=Thiothrix eikelboomii TaxID=92487 RepID=UPI003BAEF5DD